jgi:cell division protein FtsN
MPQATSRQRGGGGPGIAWILIAGAAVAMVVATFVVGVVVGRKWPEPDMPAHAASEPAKKPSAPSSARRSGLAEPAPERPPEKLTFYQTLTAPVGPVVSAPVVAPAKAPEPPKPRPLPERAASAPSATAPGPATSASAPKTVRPAALDDRAASRTPSPVSTGDWAVQVGAFRDRTQAETVKKQMAAAGFDAYLAAVEAGPGEVKYKVRLGSFRSREDAGRVADRVRSERSLPAFVTAK